MCISTPTPGLRGLFYGEFDLYFTLRAFQHEEKINLGILDNTEIFLELQKLKVLTF